MKDHYTLMCAASKTCFADIPKIDGSFLLQSPQNGKALLRTQYKHALMIEETVQKGLFAFSWLPKKHEFPCTAHPITYKSKKLSRHLGLSNLYITYSGYNPNIGAYNYTGTFKEFEAIGVFARQGYRTHTRLVLASAGNTARAFCEIGSKLHAKVVIVVPHDAVKNLWTTVPKHPHIRVLAVDGTYNDAIAMAQRISRYDGCIAEGGVYNIGRRDALGTTFLSAVACMKRIPDHYVQAIGSGSGAISAWESSMRLQKLGMYTESQQSVHHPQASSKTRNGHPIMHIAQNAPFAPVVESWNANSKTFHALQNADETEHLKRIYARVLANNNPPYSIAGGLYEMLCDCEGYAYACSNEEGKKAGELFQALEGFRISASSEIALAALCCACAQQRISPEDYVMLNITGGAYHKKQDFKTYEVSIDTTLSPTIEEASLVKALRELHIL